MPPVDLNIYSINLQDGQFQRVSSLAVNEESPEWFPNQNKIAYSSFSPSGIDLHIYDVDAQRETLLIPNAGGIHLAISSDGTRILEPGRMKNYSALDGSELADLKSGVMSALQSAGYSPDTRYPGQANRGTFPLDGDFSTDGQFIVFDGAVQRSGTYGVILCRITASGGQFQVLSDIIPTNPAFSNNHNYSQLNPMYRKTVSASSFTIANRAGVSLTSAGGSDSATVGYARIQPARNNATPSGMAIFGFRQGGVLVTEAAVPASAALRSGRIYAEINGPGSYQVGRGWACARPLRFLKS